MADKKEKHHKAIKGIEKAVKKAVEKGVADDLIFQAVAKTLQMPDASEEAATVALMAKRETKPTKKPKVSFSAPP